MKSQEILDALAAGDVVSALRIAAHLHDRSADTLTYKRGLDAQTIQISTVNWAKTRGKKMPTERSR